MSRQMRLLAGLGVVALLGLGALSYLARQYERRASLAVAAEAAPSRAARLVAGFLAAGATGAPGAEDLEGAGITRDEYARVREAAVAWASHVPVADEALRDALAARGGEVRAALAR